MTIEVGSVRPSERAKTTVLIATHRGTAKHIPVVRRALAAFWPDHPPIRFLCDGGLDAEPDVYIEGDGTFVSLLAAGLDRLQSEFPEQTHCLLLLEDHSPLRRCDSHWIERTVDLAVAHRLPAVAFPTYQWPWNTTEQVKYADGLVRTWREIDVVRIGDELLARVPKDFFRYFQVQPTIWRIEYLKEACTAAILEGHTSPWQFEAFHWSRAEQHYVSRCDWPTVHHGFLAQGAINPAAIDYVDGSLGRDIRRELVRAYMHPFGSHWYTVRRGAQRAARQMKRVQRRITGWLA